MLVKNLLLVILNIALAAYLSLMAGVAELSVLGYVIKPPYNFSHL